IKTDFDLIVTFDWNSYARVILPNTYAGAVCGLCGNANGDPGDDFASPDSQQAPDEIQFADSWKVADVPGCSAACTGDCRVCTEEEKRPYRGDKHCGLLVKKRGPFAPCHDVIDPTPYFQDCLFDACLYKGHQESVCSIVTAYVTACQSQGVAIRRWRTAAFCSPVCPPNQHYELCGPPCPPTCSGQREAEECHAATGTACVEGCYCDAGFLASGAECVPVARCGCRHQGRYYQLGEEFYPQNDACERRCVCRGAGAVECAQQGCGEDEECGVRDGVRGCHPREGCGRCQALGGGVYTTLDGLRLVVTGSCKRTMAEAEDDDPQRPLVPFAVEVEEDEEGGKGGPQIRQVTVTVRGVAIGMARGVPWEVSGERHLLPLTLEDLGVTVTQEGLHRLLRVQGGPRILYDGAAFALLLLPSPFHSRTRGLCGDFNGDPQNDLGGPPQDLGGSCTPPSLPPPPPDCPTPGPCGVLLDAAGPFGGCHEVVSPQSYVLGCRRLGCTPPDPQILCESLQGYAAACQAAGGQLRDWREAAGC
ncbi:FCGBP protein, partial [Podargus strigoides]|nr:FCGBP protein [Podargus strigoides]